jgi:hypothetical protein
VMRRITLLCLTKSLHETAIATVTATMMIISPHPWRTNPLPSDVHDAHIPVRPMVYPSVHTPQRTPLFPLLHVTAPS